MIPEPSEMQAVVYVVDDDASVRDALQSLLRCLVLDVRLPGVSGLDFQSELAKAGIQVPIVFMTGHGDIPMTVKAMRAGAIEFLTKPFREQDMLDAVQVALAFSLQAAPW